MTIAEFAAEMFADNWPQTHDQQVEVARAVAGPYPARALESGACVQY
ncbi:hypothetical protein ACIHDR_46315 [Nocardia sp. NPDC052278]